MDRPYDCQPDWTIHERYHFERARVRGAAGSIIEHNANIIDAVWQVGQDGHGGLRITTTRIKGRGGGACCWRVEAHSLWSRRKSTALQDELQIICSMRYVECCANWRQAVQPWADSELQRRARSLIQRHAHVRLRTSIQVGGQHDSQRLIGRCWRTFDHHRLTTY